MSKSKSRHLAELRKLEMTIEHDEGVFRCLLFKSPATLDQHFRLTTWPGHLAFSGDMGSYVFARTHDMFRFFRNVGGPAQWSVNPDYWSEKLQAEDVHSHDKRGRRFSPDVFESTIKQIAVEHIRENMRDATRGDRRTFWTRIRHLSENARDEHEAVAAAIDFSSHGLTLHDVCEYDFRMHSPWFLWACHAIAWGIATYDDTKARKAGELAA